MITPVTPLITATYGVEIALIPAPNVLFSTSSGTFEGITIFT